MKKASIYAIGMALVIMCVFGIYSFAEAKRFGGGGSFGKSNSSINRSFTQTKPKQQAPMQNATPVQQNRGFFGGMGGMFTALLAGSLLGSFLGGGAFGGIGMIDILLFGGIAYLLYKLFIGSRTKNSTEPYSQYSAHNRYDTTSTIQNNTPLHSAWASLGAEEISTPEQDTAVTRAIPNFDEADFLKGAKLLFNRMQESWSKRDIEDIARFTTADVLSEIQRQAKEDSTPSTTTVLHLQAEVVNTDLQDDEESVDVLFTALIQEGNDAKNITVNEAWYFVRSTATNKEWKLAGITQV